MRALLAVAFVVGAGCGDDAVTVGAPDALISIDAGPDAPNHPLVGEWQQYDPTARTSQYKNLLALGADGKLSLKRTDHTFVGVWDILPDGRLHTMKDSLSEAGDYYVSADRLITGALVPSGPISGVVGTWTTHDNFANLDNYRTIVLRADLTMSFTFTGDHPLAGTGTYSLEGTHLILTSDEGDTFYLVAIPDVAIGQLIWERLP